MVVSRSIHIATKGIISFIFMAEWYSVCVCVCVCVCVYAYHIFFISSSVDRRLVGFYVLPIVNSAATNIEGHAYFKLEFYQDICPGVRLLDHRASLILVFLRTLCIVFRSDCTNLHSHRQ